MSTPTPTIADQQTGWAFLSHIFKTIPYGLTGVLWPDGDPTSPADAAGAVNRLLAGDRTLPDSIVAAQVNLDDLDEVRATVAEASAAGWRTITPDDAEWPADAFAAAYPGGTEMPAALWVRGAGDLHDLSARAVTIVGDQPLTDEEQTYNARLAGDLAARGYTVVATCSKADGGRLHGAAAAAGGAAIAVVGHGPLHHCPEHSQTYRRIAARGLVVTATPGAASGAGRWSIPRDHLLAALGGGVLVTDAGAATGSVPQVADWHDHALFTAHRARLTHRPVLCVPGPPSDRAYAGSNRLLVSGGGLPAVTAEDVLAVVDPEMTDEVALAAWEVPADVRTRALLNGWSPALQLVRESVGEHADRVGRLSEVARDCSMSERLVVRLIGQLESKGVLVRSGGWWFPNRRR
jgi:DNA processing protein